MGRGRWAGSGETKRWGEGPEVGRLKGGERGRKGGED